MARSFYYYSKLKNEYVEIKNFYRKFIFLTTFFATLSAFFIFSGFFITNYIFSSPNYFFSRKEIQHEILTAISNGADLNVVKQIYSNRDIEEFGFTSFFEDFENKYESSTPLSIILSDIKIKQFLKEKPPDSLLIKKINLIQNEYTKTNPFDKLNNFQKEQFKNILIKLDKDYSKIQPELDKLSNELYNKNLAVNEYLTDATVGFWFSVIALIFSITMGITQIYLEKNRRNTLRAELNIKKNKDDE